MVKIIETYTLHEQIGEGQYGKVYRGIDSRNGKEVAAKVINVKRFKDNPKLQECTLNEIEVLTKIDSPHIVRFIEILKTINNFYFFYEYCNGGTLDQQIRKNGCLSQPKIVEYLDQLVDAFKILTANNIMHRDLKPSNILIHNGKIKLGDFGFCKSLQSQRDLAQTMLGSPIYMAPEVLRGEIYTIKADIWSLGVVIYEMAFGYCPFQENSIAKLINALEHQELQISKEINNISPQLEDLLKQILVKDHFKRISWEELFAYNFKNGKISKHGHHRALSQANRIVKKQFRMSFEKENSGKACPSDTKFLKKKNQYEQQSKGNLQQIHLGLKECVKTIDRMIRLNSNPEITCILALQLYRMVTKNHQKLGNTKQFIKQRMELNEALSSISSLIENQSQQMALFEKVKTTDKNYSSLSSLLRQNDYENSTINHKQLQKCLAEATLLKNTSTN